MTSLGKAFISAQRAWERTEDTRGFEADERTPEQVRDDEEVEAENKAENLKEES